MLVVITLTMEDSVAHAYGYTNGSERPVELIFSQTKIHDRVDRNPIGHGPKILTYNVWTSQNIQYSHYADRAAHLVSIMLEQDPDIIFLQEVGVAFLKFLKADPKFTSAYDFSLNEILNKNCDDYPNIDTNAITLVLSKNPIYVSTYNIITGDYPHSFTTAEIDKFLLVNCHLHAGSRFSPGITYHQKYHKYRAEQIKIIHRFVTELNIKQKPIIFGGDFNMDLDNTNGEFPETKEINRFGLVDCWKKIHPDLKGYTENTEINTMRWNLKQQTKMFRYDGFFCSDEWTILFIEIVGTKPVFHTKIQDELLDPIFSKHISKANLKIDQMKSVNGFFEWFPSDHFGVVAQFVIPEKKIEN